MSLFAVITERIFIMRCEALPPPCIRRINELNCDISHFGKKQNRVANNTRYTLDEILVKNSTYASIARLKQRLIKEGKMEYKCANCGIVEWQGQKLSLHLDHINGINNDHRLENVRFLCPNCHSLTDTYAGKNKKQEE